MLRLLFKDLISFQKIARQAVVKSTRLMNKDELQTELEGYGLPRVHPSEITLAALIVQVDEQREARGIVSPMVEHSIGCRTNSAKKCLILATYSRVILDYLNLIGRRSRQAGWSYPKIDVFGETFYTSIVKKDRKSRDRWVDNIIDCGLLIIPIFIFGGASHIAIAVIDITKQTISYYDSDLNSCSFSEVDHRLETIRYVF